ncbi:MAG: nascent polypeptide-associated complex protein [Candidatus Micrarchaeia archaeon]
MIPNLDPRTIKSILDSMGIKSEEINALRVTIEGTDRDIIISSPQIIVMEQNGMRIFQIMGSVQEKPKELKIEITDDDIELVREQTGIADSEVIRKALEETNGNIAEAIIRLNKDKK